MKIQIWVRPDQRELLQTAVCFLDERLANEAASGNAHLVAGKYTRVRLQELKTILLNADAKKVKQELQT